jgi:hypothetical protein
MFSFWGIHTMALVRGDTRTTLCECGHDLSAHEHYRRGPDCGLCGCDHYQRSR